ncbi:MAG: diguanylate cyclase [Alphaproteobacteria bacterium]|nr:diguanylate cyclase [Alphaproteobacteria bacterium]
MKITGNRPVAPPRRATASENVARTDPVSSSRDTITIAGIPRSELTPRVMQALTQLIDEVNVLRSELATANQRIGELSTLAFTDPLTGVHNRRAFVGELDRTLAMVERHDQPASIAYFDLDDMKSINDGFGHAGGDAAITHVATTIKENVRATDVVGRLGGDEFGVIFAYADRDSALGKVQEIQSLISDADVRFGDKTFRVSVTAGVAPLQKGETPETALNVADAAMYVGKANKKTPVAKAS